MTIIIVGTGEGGWYAWLVISHSTELSVRGVLESSTLLNSLSDVEMEELAKVSRLKSCQKGELIWSSGAETGFIGLVGTGFVKLVQSTALGVEMTMEITGPGQIFGLLGAITGGGCPLTAYGLTDTVFLRIPKPDILAIYEKSGELKDRLVRRTTIRMHQKLDFMGKLSSGRSEERIAAILFILSESYGIQDGKSIRISIPLTRQAIGEMAGTTTATTIRVMSKWSKTKMVLTDQQHIIISDPEKLSERLR